MENGRPPSDVEKKPIDTKFSLFLTEYSSSFHLLFFQFVALWPLEESILRAVLKSRFVCPNRQKDIANKRRQSKAKSVAFRQQLFLAKMITSKLEM